MIKLIPILNEIEIDDDPVSRIKRTLRSIRNLYKDIKDPVVKQQIKSEVSKVLFKHRWHTSPLPPKDASYYKNSKEHRIETNRKLNQIRRELEDKISKEKVDPISRLISPIKNEPLNLKIGKYDVSKGENGEEFTWEEAISNPSIISKATKNKCLKIYNILGITPQKVLRSSTKPNGSTYIIGYYGKEPVICAQRQTVYKGGRSAAGQFYLYSQYKKTGKNAGLGPDNSGIPAENSTKEEILNYLKIPQ